jgi:sugar/nucleoside kinase (ribokinase family)
MRQEFEVEAFYMNYMIKLLTLFSCVLISFFSFASSDVNKKYDVVAIGKAMVDVIQYVSDEELIEIAPKGVRKTDSNRINDLIADNLYLKMKNPIIIPGGSEANVVVNIASLGGRSAFNAIAADDEFGILFKNSLIHEKVSYLSALVPQDKDMRTARCFTFITPDKERTFIVSADISKKINDDFVNYDSIKNSKVFYTDASNLTGEGAEEVTLKAINIAKENGTKVAFNLNNNYYVENHREQIIELLPKIDIFMGSEKEAMSLFKSKSIDQAVDEYLKKVKIVVITLGKRGAIIATSQSRLHIPVVEIAEIKDLNGAGDGFVAGFLYGYTHRFSLKKSGEIAAKTAAQIISQIGARPRKKLRSQIL